MLSPRKKIDDIERFESVVGILFSEGCGYILDRLRLTDHLPIHKKLRAERHERPGPERVRETFEKLGATYIKFGQMLAQRKDLIPSEYADELKKLENEVPAFPGEKAKKVVDEEVGMEKFSYFDEEPLASASVAQVHRAELETGEEVAVKVRRPGIREKIEQDLDILHYLASKYESLEGSDRKQVLRDLEEFADWTRREIDFTNEARNGKRLKEELSDWDRLRVPEIYEDYCTEKIVIMEYIDAVRCDNIKEIKSRDIDFREIAEIGVKAQLDQILRAGFFHADPHPSNFLIDEEGNLVYLDFGIMGKLTRDKRRNICLMFFSMVKGDVEGVLDALRELGYESESADIDALEIEVEKTVKSLQDTTIGEQSFTRAFASLSLKASNHGLYMPNDLIVMGKGMATMEGIGMELYPEYDFSEQNKDFLKDILKSYFEPEEESEFVLADLLRNRDMLEKPFSSLRRKEAEQKIEINTPENHSEKLLGSSIVLLASSVLYLSAGPKAFLLAAVGIVAIYTFG